MTSQRLSAVIALVAFVAGLTLLAVHAVQSFPRGLVAVGALVLAVLAAWQGLLRSGAARVAWWVAAGVLLLGAVVAALSGDKARWVGLAGVLLVVVGVTAAKRAFTVHAHLPPAPPPQRAVMVWNPRSGGGKAVRFDLAAEAAKRGITPIELKPGDDLEALVRQAVAEGSDGLMAAGGDGTQALVATIAAEHDLPFACIPAGTRNHFALDLGVDRDDVVGALDAFVNGGEKRVDLGEVAGRTFVNNVSFGLYAQAVRQQGYRDAKVRTLLSTAPAALGGESGNGDGAEAHELRWTGPNGEPEHSAAVILVSNNAYRLGRVIGSGTRPRIDQGALGVSVIGGQAETGEAHRRPLQEWQTPEFTVDSDADVAAGVDGEALTLPAPVTLRIRPAALRVRIAPQHPGASPSAAQPTGLVDAVQRLWHIAGGADPMALAHQS